MLLGNKRYWIFQLVGWSAFLTMHIFFAWFYGKFSKPADQEFLLLRAFVYVAIGVLLTHLMRMFILKFRLLSVKIQRQILYFILLSIFTAFICGYAEQIAFRTLHLNSARELELMKSKSFLSILLMNTLSWMMYILSWNSFYLIYHYITYAQQERIQTLQLKSLVKELELNTIKSNINPHFIFNALNSIRALVNENPDRARDAITELSNILRSSINMHKTQTVPLNQEIKIVEDYLALEYIRFEDRLKVVFEIDKDTLPLPIPPMMVQSMVENAIKHGISQKVNGGTIKISAQIKKTSLELLVLNTGRLNGNGKNDGFGVKSTNERLNLIYGEKGCFAIKQLDADTVQAKVTIRIN